jgi:hypothetical protein
VKEAHGERFGLAALGAGGIVAVRTLTLHPNPTRSPTMKKLHGLATCAAMVVAAGAYAQTAVVPAGVNGLAGTGGYSNFFRNLARSVQIEMDASVVTAAGIAPSTRITGISFRNPSYQVFPTWPATGLTATFTNYDVTLSRSTRSSAQGLSTTYTDNIGPDAVMVRSGGLALPSGFLPGGALTPNVNPWSGVITFTTPFLYTGGNLLLTIRHTGAVGAGTGNVEATPDAFVAGTAGIQTQNYTQVTGWTLQGMVNMKFTIVPGTPPCGTADFNCDGDVGTDRDIEAFFQCLSGTCPAAPCTNSADFNGDGDVGTDEDIESFFRVLGGGHC